MNAIIRRSPVRTLALMEPLYRPSRLIEEVEAMARELFESGRPLWTDTGLFPAMDMYREGDELIAKVELPGIKKKDMDISLEDDVLTIKAEKSKEEVSEGTTNYTRERNFGKFSRSMSLPFHVDADKVSATFRNGLLEIRLPKAEKAKSRHIEVNIK